MKTKGFAARFRHALGLRHARRGSAIVEAAMIVPLIILIIFGILKMGITLTERVEEASLPHKIQAETIAAAKGIKRAEVVQRSKWIARNKN